MRWSAGKMISPSTSRRGAAAKARRSLNPKSDPSANLLEQVEKTVKFIQRKRKGRHAKLKELITMDDEERNPLVTGEDSVCPVCLQVIHGDLQMVEAHVDQCVIAASQIQVEAEERERRGQEALQGVDAWEEVEVNGEVRLRLTNVNGLRGSGFHIRDRNQPDVEEDVDVDGDDEAVFGGAQFTERDVLNPSFEADGMNIGEDAVVDIDDDEPGGRKTLRDLVAEGKVITRMSATNLNGVRTEMEEIMGVGDADRMDQAIVAARESSSPKKLIAALEDKIKQLVRPSPDRRNLMKISQPSILGIHACLIFYILTLSYLP